MFNKNIEQLQKIHYQQLLQEAKQDRLIRQALDSQRENGQLYSPSVVQQAVAWIGDRMITAGHRIKGQPMQDCSGRPAVNY